MKFETYLNESINDKGIFKAIFMAGAPGAGKSTVRSKLGGGFDPRVVNTDKFTEHFGGWDGFEENINLLTKNQLALYLNSMLPLWVDGTSSNPTNLMAREGLVSSIGYDTGMIWVNTSLESSIKRAKGREERGGRKVGEEWIKETYNEIQKMKGFYKGRFNWFQEVDNNDGMLTDEVVMKMYKKANSFFSSPISNPIGQERINTLREEGGKYLIDLDDFDDKQLNNRVRAWFVK
jgi:shikimate kinase